MPALEGFLDPGLDGLDELLGDGAARDVVLEDETLAGGGEDLDLGVPVLPAAAGLLDVPALGLGFLADRLLVGHLGLAHVGFHGELPLQALHQDLEVQLAHARDLGLAGVLVGLDLEGRVFLHELGQAGAELLLVALGLGLHGQGDHGRGERDRFQHHGVVGVADRVAGGDVLEADRGRDVARVDLLDLLPLVRVHLEEAADPLALALRAVEHPVARLHVAGVDPDERELAHEGVGHDLEDEGAEGRVVLGRTRAPAPRSCSGRWPWAWGRRGARAGSR